MIHKATNQNRCTFYEIEKKPIKSRIESKYDIMSDNNWAQSKTGHSSPEGFIQPISQT